MTVHDAPHLDGPLWAPGGERAARAQIVRLARELAPEGAPDTVSADGGLDYASLHAWTVSHPEKFWPAVWRFCGVRAEERPGRPPWDEVVRGADRVAPPDESSGPRWFLGARLNFAENLLRHRDEREAIVAWNEEGRYASLSHAALFEAVTAVAAALRREGIVAGDRVAAFMPNIPETVIAMLATTSLGAIWSSCSPDFGVNGVLDRFGQIEPRVLIACDGYTYAGKAIDTLERVAEIAARAPSIQRVVVVPYLRRTPAPELSAVRAAVTWGAWCGAGAGTNAPGPRTRGAPPEHHHGVAPSAEPHPSGATSGGSSPATSLGFLRLPFDHPVYIMYSSGTTGLPKCMVHGAGGTLLQHLKEHVLHTDLTRDDRIFYFTTCGWMMWNWLVSALAVGATVVLYDGAPLAPAVERHSSATAGEMGRRDLLWQMAAAERITVFGTSAKYLALAEKEGLCPGMAHDLSALRCILSTGSPLAPASFDYVYRDIKRDVQLSSISGGTDIISCFALGNPAGPVWRGELQALGLGMAVDVLDGAGRPVRGAPGELVCTRPFPSMPVAFWNDTGGAKYRAAYFERFPGVWHHGDWAELTPHGGLIITGRSDATLNPGGVRIGTAEIYRQVEQLPEILESVVVGQEVGAGRDLDVRIVLFVRLREGATLDDALRDAIRRRIREHTSPHHVPRVIVAVADIPRTISGKITEIAVREVIHGRPVKNTDALANPQALELFRGLAELRG